MVLSSMRFVRVLAATMALVIVTVGTALAQPTTSPPAGSTSAAAPSVPRAPSSAAPTIPAATGSSDGAAPASPPGAVDGASYAVRLRDLEQRIDELKEQIRRSHTRLSLLSDTILGGGVAGARADIVFENNMSGAFRLTRAVFVLDGAVQYNKADDSGAMSDVPTLPIYTGSIPPGDHTLQVLLELRGNGYGVFSYLRGYRFEVRSSHSFTAVEGKAIGLRAIAYEKGGVTTSLEERPAIRYVEKVAPLQADAAARASQSPSAPGASLSAGGRK